MFRKLNIGNKLALILIAFALAVTAFLSASFYLQFEQALRERVLLQLSSVKQLKMSRIKAELQDRMVYFLETDSSENTGFEILQIANELPNQVLGYDLTEFKKGNSSPRMIDLTYQNPQKGMTILFIHETNGAYKIGLVRLPEVQEILLQRTGLGETGESYLVDEKFRLISRSRFTSKNNDLLEIKTQGVTQAFQGNPGADAFQDYRGIQVLGAFEMLEMYDLKWVIMSEIDYDEAMAPLSSVRNNLMITLIIIMAFIFIVSYYLSGLIVKPIVAMENRLINLSKGLLERPPIPDRQDEIGHMFTALDKVIKALEETVLFAGKIGDGDFEAEYEKLSDEDNLGSALLEMKRQLKAYKENERMLLAKNQRSLVDGEEKERARLSKELHDGLGPILTSLRMQIQATELNQTIKNDLLNRMDETIREVRNMSNNLMPSVLKDFGAGEAIGNLVKQLSENSDVEIMYKNDMHPNSQIHDEVQITLYRVTQEAINNALKHSNCQEIKISISEFDEYIGLFVFDNGEGFDLNQVNNGNGIRNIHERIKLVNGKIEMTSDPSGTKMEIEIPKI